KVGFVRPIAVVAVALGIFSPSVIGPVCGTPASVTGPVNGYSSCFIPPANWDSPAQSVAHLDNLWWIMTGKSTSTTCGAHLFPSTAHNRSLPEEPASARASLPMQSCMLQRTSMSRFVNDEGHEGTRSKMLLRLIDGLLSCVALSVVLSVIAPQPALAGGPRY